MSIDANDLKKLPPRVKVLLVCLIYFVLSYLYFMLYLQGALEKHENLSTKLTGLQQQVAEKEKMVAQLGTYTREVVALKESFKLALMMLPNQKEIPDLLLAVANAGRSSGVDFLVFEPKMPEKKSLETNPAAAKPNASKAAAPVPAAKPADVKGQPPKPVETEKFYEELPIRVQLAGGFQNTLSFFDQVARLPRIVNIEDITMGDVKDVKGRGRVMKTSCTVKTYMFVDKR
jgi:type IV pilus assembly protein PilO